jgi:predicted kinase
MKELILLRGLPGSGKSTVAKLFGGEHYEADMFFLDSNNNYVFHVSKLKSAHAWCQDLVYLAMMRNEERIVVSNTFTQEWEMDAYYKLAETHGYRVTALIVENRHGGVNVHDVPTDKLEQMRNRFEIKL